MTALQRLFIALLPLAATACVGEPEPTTFVLTNAGDSDVYVTQADWLTLEVDGAPASLREPGCMAECGLIVQGIACAAAVIYPTIDRLAPGDTDTMEWDGTYFEINEARNCYKRRERQANFVATLCYSHEYTSFDELAATPDQGDRTIGGAYIENPTCESVSFERGTQVELAAE